MAYFDIGVSKGKAPIMKVGTIDIVANELGAIDFDFKVTQFYCFTVTSGRYTGAIYDERVSTTQWRLVSSSAVSSVKNLGVAPSNYDMSLISVAPNPGDRITSYAVQYQTKSNAVAGTMYYIAIGEEIL